MRLPGCNAQVRARPLRRPRLPSQRRLVRHMGLRGPRRAGDCAVHPKAWKQECSQMIELLHALHGPGQRMRIQQVAFHDFRVYMPLRGDRSSPGITITHTSSPAPLWNRSPLGKGGMPVRGAAVNVREDSPDKWVSSDVSRQPRRMLPMWHFAYSYRSFCSELLDSETQHVGTRQGEDARWQSPCYDSRSAGTPLNIWSA